MIRKKRKRDLRKGKSKASKGARHRRKATNHKEERMEASRRGYSEDAMNEVVAFAAAAFDAADRLGGCRQVQLVSAIWRAMGAVPGIDLDALSVTPVGLRLRDFYGLWSWNWRRDMADYTPPFRNFNRA